MKQKNIEKLTMFLRKGGNYTSKELSERLQIERRTLQTYLKELTTNAGLIKDKTMYYFPKEFLNSDIEERVNMSSALMLSLYKHAIPDIKESVLENFKVIPKEIDAFLFDIHFEALIDEAIFNRLINAIMKKQALIFEYTDTKGVSSTKNVFPLKMANFKSYWYLMGFDLESGKVKTYYLNMITTIEEYQEEELFQKEKERLERESSHYTSPWMNDDMKSVTLKVLGEAIRYIKRQDTQLYTIREEKKSGELMIEMHYYSDIEVLSFVKQWLPDVTIVDNRELKQKLYATLESYIKNEG